MNIIRQLDPDEYETWNRFVASSPQGSLFHTIEWNQMMRETDPQMGGVLPLVSLGDKGIQAGIIVCYHGLSEKRMVDPPMFGYTSPILAPDSNYADRQHTYRNYSILADLLKKLMSEVDHVRLANSPDIWDTRPYTFQSWEVETAYTHIWERTSLIEAWNGIDLELQKNLHTAEQKFVFEAGTEEHFQQFIKLAGGRDVLQKRIDWLRKRDLCRLFLVNDQQRSKSGMTLAILSRENRTAYLWGSTCNDMNSGNEILPYLFWKSYEALAEEFPRMDLGESGKSNVGLMKDKLGCEPVPRFITTYQNRHAVEKKTLKIPAGN